MKYLMTLLLLLTVAIPAYSQLTQDDLNQIRLIIKEEIKASETQMKAEIKASETRMKDEIKAINADITSIKDEIKAINADITSIKENVAKLDGRLDGTDRLITGLIVIIVALLGIPQVVALWRNIKDRTLEKQVETLAQKVEALENGRIQSS